MCFKEITKTLPLYNLFINDVNHKNILRKIKLKEYNNINIKNKYKYYYYYLYKIFGKDLALKLIINYIIKLYIQIPPNFYYKLYTNYCYELYINKLMLVKSDNQYILTRILNIRKKTVHITDINILQEVTYLHLENLGLNIILNNTNFENNIKSIGLSNNKKIIKLIFEHDEFLDNQENIIKDLYKNVCL